MIDAPQWVARRPPSQRVGFRVYAPEVATPIVGAPGMRRLAQPPKPFRKSTESLCSRACCPPTVANPERPSPVVGRAASLLRLLLPVGRAALLPASLAPAASEHTGKPCASRWGSKLGVHGGLNWRGAEIGMHSGSALGECMQGNALVAHTRGAHSWHALGARTASKSRPLRASTGAHSLKARAPSACHQCGPRVRAQAAPFLLLFYAPSVAVRCPCPICSEWCTCHCMLAC